MAVNYNPKTFDPKLNHINFNGVIMNQDLGEGAYLSVTPVGDEFEESVGADGGIDRINKNNIGYTVEYTCKQTSTVNDQLSALAIADRIANTGKGPLTILDLNGTSLFAGTAWIKKKADYENADSVQMRTWTLFLVATTANIGGNIL